MSSNQLIMYMQFLICDFIAIHLEKSMNVRNIRGNE